MASLTDKQKFDKRVKELDAERSAYMDYWGELADNHIATKGRFLNKGGSRRPKRNTKQYNNTSRMSARTLGSGMMAGITSPARPWMKLAASNPELNDIAAVKNWLYRAETNLYRVFAQSNTYNSLHSLYAELGVFGVAAMGVYENFEDIIRCKTYTIGSFMLGIGADDKIDTFAQETQKSVGQLVKEFGIDNVSETVKRNWNNGNIETMIDVVHLIEPNDNRDMLSPMARDKRYRSVYYETAQNKGDNLFLRRSGFDEFPIMPPRWDVKDGEIYCDSCPGMDSLGDAKGLQLGERRFYQALDKVGLPPLQGDSALKSQITGGAPNAGEIIWHSANSKGLTPVYGNYQPRVDLIQQNQDRVELRIKRAFYEDLFLMLANTDRKQITAREIAEKHEEKLLMLGPVLERLHTELLDPLVARTFNILQRNGVLPPPPKELENTEISVQYVSVLAQAQRMVGLSSIERTVGFAMQMAAMWPEARHKINAMETVDQYANDSGASPRIIRPDDEAEGIASAEQEARAQQQQMMNVAQGAQNAKTISEVDGEGTAAMMRKAGLL